ncbi:hypothetical protein Plhal304r1_c016g0059791 [Plasmopara halstedii]
MRILSHIVEDTIIRPRFIGYGHIWGCQTTKLAVCCTSGVASLAYASCSQTKLQAQMGFTAATRPVPVELGRIKP